MTDLRLEIDDRNTGDYGRPLGTYALKVKKKAMEILIARGVENPSDHQIDALYMKHMQSLPTYREISAALTARSSKGSAASFTREELERIAARFAGSNDEMGQSIFAKAEKLHAAMSPPQAKGDDNG